MDGRKRPWWDYADNLLNSETSGNININTTYVTKAASTFARWKKLGRIVTVELYDIDLKAGYSTDNVAIIGTGLPAPKDGSFQTSIAGLNLPTLETAQTRLLVDSSGRLKPWFIGTTVVTAISGSFSYISAS